MAAAVVGPTASVSLLNAEILPELLPYKPLRFTQGLCSDKADIGGKHPSDLVNWLLLVPSKDELGWQKIFESNRCSYWRCWGRGNHESRCPAGRVALDGARCHPGAGASTYVALKNAP
jgi:hypothetical protein